MKAIKLMILLFAVLLAQDLFAKPAPQIIEEEPDVGGWHVAYGNELTAQQAAQGYVDSQLSLFSGNAEAIEAWADFMLRQAVALMVHQAGPELADQFTRDEQREAGMFGVATIKKLLRSRTAGSEQINLSSSFAFKAGVFDRGDKFIPYLALRMHPAPVLIEEQISEYRKNHQAQKEFAEPTIIADELPPQAAQAVESDIIVKSDASPLSIQKASALLPSAHVWEYLTSFGAEPAKYATYSYVLTGRNGGAKYIELVNYIQGSTASAKEMEEERILIPEEMNIFLVPAINTDGSAYAPDYKFSIKILTALDARSKATFDRPGPYIITMNQPISSLKKGDAVADMLYVDLTNINKGAIAEVVRAYKQTVMNKRLNGTDKLYSLRLALLNLAFMTEESIGFAKTASASLDPVFSGGKK